MTTRFITAPLTLGRFVYVNVEKIEAINPVFMIQNGTYTEVGEAFIHFRGNEERLRIAESASAFLARIEGVPFFPRIEGVP
jgi:hypothetical protein